MEVATRRISDMETGETSVIAGFVEQSEMILRLQEMGILPGVGVELVRRAPMGGPIEIKVKGYRLSLRLGEAALVEVVS